MIFHNASPDRASKHHPPKEPALWNSWKNRHRCGLAISAAHTHLSVGPRGQCLRISLYLSLCERAERNTKFDNLAQGGNERFATIQTKRLGAGILTSIKFLKAFRFNSLSEDSLFLPSRRKRKTCLSGTFNTGLYPSPSLGSEIVHEIPTHGHRASQ